jgi:hypothetical protein
MADKRVVAGVEFNQCCDLSISKADVMTERPLRTMIGAIVRLEIASKANAAMVVLTLTYGYIGSGTNQVSIPIPADDWLDANRRVVEKIQSLKAKEKHGG